MEGNPGLNTARVLNTAIFFCAVFCTTFTGTAGPLMMAKAQQMTWWRLETNVDSMEMSTSRRDWLMCSFYTKHGEGSTSFEWRWEKTRDWDVVVAEIGKLVLCFQSRANHRSTCQTATKMCTRQNRIDRMVTPLGRLSLQSFRATRWLALDHCNDEHLTDLIHLRLKTFI